jgi:hypothetical protein
LYNLHCIFSFVKPHLKLLSNPVWNRLVAIRDTDYGGLSGETVKTETLQTFINTGDVSNLKPDVINQF